MTHEQVKDVIARAQRAYGLSTAKLAQTLGVTDVSIRRWKAGMRLPSPQVYALMEMLADGTLTPEDIMDHLPDGA